MCEYVATHIACHHFAVWHDHTTVCGCRFIMVACKEVYDRLVHYIDTKYKAPTGQSVDVQALVEGPYLHLFAADSSSPADHIAFTVDRLACVQVLDAFLQAANGTEITDTLRFFNGDKVSQWIEGGCQGGCQGEVGTTSVVLVAYPVSPSLTLRAAIKLHTGPLQMPKPTCLQEFTAEKETV